MCVCIVIKKNTGTGIDYLLLVFEDGSGLKLIDSEERYLMIYRKVLTLDRIDWFSAVVDLGSFSRAGQARPESLSRRFIWQIGGDRRKQIYLDRKIIMKNLWHGHSLWFYCDWPKFLTVLFYIGILTRAWDRLGLLVAWPSDSLISNQKILFCMPVSWFGALTSSCCLTSDIVKP